MDESTERLDGDTEPYNPTYFEMVVTHQLHRIWELQIAQLLMLAETDDDREFINEIVAAQQRGEYKQPIQW